MYYLGIIYSLNISLNLVPTLIFKIPHLVLGRMCLPSLIVINPNPNPPNSTSALYNNLQEPQMGKWTYSSHEQLKALDNTKQSTGDKPKPRLVPYKAIATIRMPRINQKPIRTRHNRLRQLKQKGINRGNLLNIQISEVTIPKPNMQCKIAMVNAQSIRNKDILLTQEIAVNNINITLITETWLNDTPQDTAWLH